MRTKVFAYSGFIGVESDYKAEGLLNNPAQPNELGFVIDADFVDITEDALELLKNIKKSHDDIGDVDVFKSDKKTIFSWMGGCFCIIDPESAEGSREYNPSLLKPSNQDILIPEGFKEYIDHTQNQIK